MLQPGTDINFSWYYILFDININYSIFVLTEHSWYYFNILQWILNCMLFK